MTLSSRFISKSLDRIFILCFLVITATAIGALLTIERNIEQKAVSMRIEQLNQASQLLTRSVKSEIESGNTRYAWELLNQSVGYSGLVGFLVFNEDSSLAVDDREFSERYHSLRASNAWRIINRETRDVSSRLYVADINQILIVEQNVSPGSYPNTSRVHFVYDYSDIHRQISTMRITILLVFILLFVLTTGTLVFMRRNFLVSIELIASGVASILADKTPQPSAKKMMSEYFPAEPHIKRLREEFINTKKSLEDQKVHAAIGQLARQVSHDIRSPLSALNMVVASLQSLPEDKRLLVRNATQRINDIANGLLQNNRSQIVTSDGQTLDHAERDTLESEPVLLVALLDSIVSEKRVQYRERMEVEIQGDFDRGYGLFANVDPTELARVVSNLVNNSVEAIPSGGKVTVAIRGTRDHISIIVSDTGKGIHPEVLARLGEPGVTEGKLGTTSGSGLGLPHARTMVERAGGSFNIQSQIGMGTLVTLTFPRAKEPEWFVQVMSIDANSTLISVDDDQTIHQIWAGRLSSAGADQTKTKHLTFSSIEHFQSWFAQNRDQRATYLIDYEFLSQDANGLDIIERVGISSRAILVTSRYEEPAIRNRAATLGVKILPKPLAPLVPFTIKQS